MTSSADNGQNPPRTPTLTLDTVSAASTPPLQQLANDARPHTQYNNNANAAGDLAGREGDLPLSHLSIHADGRPVHIPHVPQTASSTGSSVAGSPALLASITPLPSPAGSVSGSPISKRPPPLTPLSEIEDQPLRPKHLSPDKPLYPSPKLRAVGSNGSIRVHKRNRSRSEYITSDVVKPWHRIAVSGSQTPTTAAAPALGLQREEFLAEKRGIASDQDPGQMSESTVSNSTTDTAITEDSSFDASASQGTGESFQAQSVRSGKTHTWRSIRQLGTGTFSRVMLGTREPVGPLIEERLPRISLAAIKICNLGPAGGADEKKIEVSLKRELDILRAVDHPSLIHLKAVSIMETRALLVLNYCPGGDLFEVASSRQDVLSPGFVHRVFAELVGALKYLHANWIVHRDIKLENVLVNVPPIELQQITDYETYPHSVVTLTDLGLGRFIPKPPESPLLSTRCGSEDYAAPELLMGQEYDGRSVDAWALGVLLYAMVEGRLPFDPIPGARRQSPKTHRIARCDWTWVKRADADGEWDDAKGKGYEGARECVENLLVRTRSRWDVSKLEANAWVQSGIQVESLTQHTVI